MRAFRSLFQAHSAFRPVRYSMIDARPAIQRQQQPPPTLRTLAVMRAMQSVYSLRGSGHADSLHSSFMAINLHSGSCSIGSAQPNKRPSVDRQTHRRKHTKRNTHTKGWGVRAMLLKGSSVPMPRSPALKQPPLVCEAQFAKQRCAATLRSEAQRVRPELKSGAVKFSAWADCALRRKALLRGLTDITAMSR